MIQKVFARPGQRPRRRAIALDPASTLGYLALARTQMTEDWDWDAAEISLSKAAGL